MKVGIDIRELRQGGMTGIGRYLKNILDYLAVHPSGHDYYLYSATDMSERLDEDVFTLRHVPAPFKLWFDSVGLGGAVSEDGVEVFFSPFVKAPLNVSCPIVNTVHDLLFIRSKELNPSRAPLYRAAFGWRGRRVCRRAAAVITVSEHSKQDIVELWGIDPAKIVVVPNVVPDEFGSDATTDRLIETKRSYDIKGPYVLYIGNFGPHKNVGRLIEAFARLPEELRKRYFLVLAGGHDRHVPDLKEKARTLGVGLRTKFIGFVPDEDLGPLYSGASVFVFPSLYEGFGLPPLEAMACGVPVVVSRATSLPEVVGDAGLLVRPRDVNSIRDAIERVLADPSFARAVSRRSVRRAALFRPDRVMPQLVDVLERAAHLGPSR